MTATDDDLLLAVGAYGTIFAIEGSEDRGKSYNVRRSVKDSLPGQPEEIVSSKSFGALDILIKKEPPTYVSIAQSIDRYVAYKVSRPSLVALTDVLIELVAQNHKLEKMLSESNRSRDTAEGQGDSAGSAQTGALLDGARKVLHGLRGKAEQGGNGNVP